MIVKIAKWLFLGPELSEELKNKQLLQSVIVNMASVFGSLYLVLFIIITSLNLPEGYSRSLIACEYICAVVYIAAFTVIHTTRGMKYFDFAKLVIALNSMLICGFLYSTPDGKIWSFLVPFFIVVISEFRLGLAFCLAYFFYMIFMEIFFEPREIGVIFRYYLTFLLQVACICTYEILRISNEKRLVREKEFAQSLMYAGRAHYQEMKDLHETVSILHHDFKYHIKTIDELLQAGHVHEIERYLADIKKQRPEEDAHYYCQNHAVNALLSSYAKRCKELRIRYDVRVDLPETLSIQDYDICVVLGNLLENAVEACQKLECSREIKLEIKTGDSMLAVMVKNSFNGVVNEKNGKLASTKKDGGLGLPGIQAIANNHDGHTLTEWDKNTFAAYVMLNAV
jgi:hypothetical protein